MRLAYVIALASLAAAAALAPALRAGGRAAQAPPVPRTGPALSVGGARLNDALLGELRRKGWLHTLSAATAPRNARPKSDADVYALHLGGGHVTDAGLKELAGLTGLQVLKLEGTKVTSAGLKELAALKALRRVELGRDLLTDATFRALRENDLLHVVSVSHDARGNVPGSAAEVAYVNLVGCPVTDAGLRELAGLKALGILYLNGTGVTDAGLKHLAAFPALHTLSVSEAVTDAGLADLARLRSLRVLILSDSGVTDAGLKALAGHSSLDTLRLERTRVTAAGLKEVAALKALHTLELDPAQVTDAALRLLREKGRLHALAGARAARAGQRPGSAAEVVGLNLTGAAVTDAGLRELAGLTSLTWIGVHRTGVTDEGVAWLKKSFPALKKVHR